MKRVAKQKKVFDSVYKNIEELFLTVKKKHLRWSKFSKSFLKSEYVTITFLPQNPSLTLCVCVCVCERERERVFFF